MIWPQTFLEGFARVGQLQLQIANDSYSMLLCFILLRYMFFLDSHSAVSCRFLYVAAKQLQHGNDQHEAIDSLKTIVPS